MFTLWPAYASFEDHRRGMIKVGYDADFTILSRDITRIPAAEILETKVLMTVVAGEIIYRNPVFQ